MKRKHTTRAHRRERGYALLLVVFVGTLMLIAAMTAAPGILINGRREREKEMIWRGNQYVRGIKMYYRKNGKFPTSLEDLTKPQAANVHFMRQAYKDPMNTEDGSWRLIYVGPNGQLIGSLKPQPNLVLPTGIPGAANIGTPAANLNGFGSVNSTGLGGQSSAIPGVGPQGGNPGAANGTNGTGTTEELDANGLPIGSQPTDTPTIIGGNIIGVGSKVNAKSVIVYDKAYNYRRFEFYWDPSKDAIQFGGQTNIPGTSTPGTPAGAPQGGFGSQGTTNPQGGGTNPP
ncbi:MAG: type II secretion system protein, partial [Acidobacteria bacterium]|nr:type II secretion system protein [Acidobacteriota bacterium]